MSLFGLRSRSRQPARDEAEKPFWISFSDLMTALMVLFLVALTVAMLAITHEISAGERQKADREAEIAAFLVRLQGIARAFPGVTLHGNTLDFGDRARFDSNSHRLSDAQTGLLRTFVPQVLALARDPAGEKWLKRIVVEGFADSRGGYLHNLNLSLQRSQRVLCALLAPAGRGEPMAEADRQLVRTLFLVGGSSFNSLKDSQEASRRIELRLEFLQPGESRSVHFDAAAEPEGHCPLDGA